MTTVFGILNLGANGMRSHAFGTQVSSQNASNVGTEGYSRRLAHIDPIAAQSPGLGSRAVGQKRVIDPYIERRLLGARSMMGESSARAEALRPLDEAFGDEAGNLADALDAFENAIADLSSDPSDLTRRNSVLTLAEQLAYSFRATSDFLTQRREDINGRIEDEVADLNGKLEEIARLGQEIAKTELSELEASDLRDRRDQLVREVADVVPVTVLEQEDGPIQLLLGGGQSLVTADGSVHPLSTQRNPATSNVDVFRISAGVQENVASSLTSGQLSGWIDARDGGLTSAQNALDQLAFDFTTAYNGTHSAGYGLDGITGRNLFETIGTTSSAASQVQISSAVDGVPEALAAATDPTLLPGDNRNALDLQALATNSIALGSTATAGEALRELIGDAGVTVSDALFREEASESALEQVSTLRESVSGASTDEEMVNLMQFQRSYQTSLQVIQTADEMLAELINLKR
ncbi:MAG: flagellar hook-associated protein FlgK [Myxococcota bacterium]